MADAKAKYQDGKSTLPQARPASAVEWKYSDGKSGNVGADEYVAAGGLSISVADNVTVTESISGLIDALKPSVFNNVTASESATPLIVTLVPSVFDNVSALESISGLIGILQPSVFDVVNASESTSLTIGDLGLSLSDNVNVGEGTAAFLLNLAPSVFDTIQASEVVGSLIDRLLPSVSDSATATELPFLLVGTLVPEVFDGVGVNESVAFSIITAGTTNVSVYNDVTVADACTLLIPTLIFLAQDGAFATDVPALLLPQLFTNVFDPVVVRDSASPRIPSALAARHRMMMGMGM